MTRFPCAACLVLLLPITLAGCLGGPEGGGLRSDNPDVRRERVLELGQQKPWGSGAKKELNDALVAVGQSDPDPLVRSAALASYRRQDPAAARTLAIELAADPDPLVRWDAVKVLAASNDPRARSVLLYALRSDDSSDVRREAARGLANFDDQEVLQELILRLGDPDPGVVVKAYRSLRSISGLNLGTHASRWQEWLDARNTPVPPTGSAPAVPVVAPAPSTPLPELKPTPPATPAPSENPDVEELKRFRR